MAIHRKKARLGMVIINGDDFGMNEHCTKAIAAAFSEGLITDTTIMANGAYFNEAVALAQSDGFADRIGIHLNITEGTPLTEDIKGFPDFVTNGHFNKRYNHSRELTEAEQKAIYNELTAQIKKLKTAGISITHADSHHYVHNSAHIAPIAERVCREQGISKIRLKRNLCESEDFEYNIRLRENGFITTTYFGKLIDIKTGVVPDDTEILVHPDFDKSGKLIDRRGVEDGYPVGESIPKLKAQLGSYNKLT